MAAANTSNNHSSGPGTLVILNGLCGVVSPTLDGVQNIKPVQIGRVSLRFHQRAASPKAKITVMIQKKPQETRA